MLKAETQTTFGFRRAAGCCHTVPPTFPLNSPVKTQCILSGSLRKDESEKCCPPIEKTPSLTDRNVPFARVGCGRLPKPGDVTPSWPRMHIRGKELFGMLTRLRRESMALRRLRDFNRQVFCVACQDWRFSEFAKVPTNVKVRQWFGRLFTPRFKLPKLFD